MFDDAVAAIETVANAEGVGFVFSAADPYVGVDLDDCLDLDGNLKPWAVEIMRRFSGTYAEISPSGTGIKLWCRATRSGKGRGFKYHDGAVEVYHEKRYFTVTGDRWRGAPLDIEDCNESVQWLENLDRRSRNRRLLVIVLLVAVSGSCCPRSSPKVSETTRYFLWPVPCGRGSSARPISGPSWRRSTPSDAVHHYKPRNWTR
jgi:hypothetical protein